MKYIENINENQDKYSFGGWSMSEKMFNWLKENIPTGSTILELGSGYGTIELSKFYNVISIEHDKKWIGLCKKANYIYAPIVNDWYDINAIKKGLNNKKYDVIIIDGPPEKISNRKNLIQNIDLFDKKTIFLVDDIQRENEMNLCKELSLLLNKDYSIVKESEKYFGILQSQIKHIIISRMNFTDEELMKKYIKITKEFFIPSIKWQTNKNFQLGILTNKIYDDFLKEQLDIDFIPFHGNKEFINYVLDQKFTIQTRHDIDDWMSPDYVKTIQEIYVNNIDKYDKFLIQFQPVKYLCDTNIEYEMGKYTNMRTSMFLTLCQNEVKNHIFERQHGQMHEITSNIITKNEGYVKWIIHGNNISCKKNMVP